MNLAELPVPDSEAARASLQIAERYYTPALLNHCVRSYCFAAAAGLERGLAFDAELLYVASIVHDLGLTEPFDSHSMDFESAGGQVAWVFAAGAGWAPERRDRLSEVIVRHMGDPVDPLLDAESHLLEIATALDISGRDTEAWPRDLRIDVLHAYPRLDLAAEFADRFDEQARRKPGSAAASAVRGGIRERLAGNDVGVTD